MNKKLIAFSGAVLGFMPFLASAATSNMCNGYADLTQIQGLICKVGNILDTLIPILILLGIVYFVWGVISFVISNDEEAKTRGRTKIIYGIIGLVVIVGIWGLVRIVTNTFGLNTQGNINYPNVPF